MKRPTFKLLMPLLAMIAVGVAGAQSVSGARHSVRHLKAALVAPAPAAAHAVLDTAPAAIEDAENGCALCESGSSAPAIHRVAPTPSFRAPAQLRDVPWDAENDAEFFETASLPRGPPAVSL